MSDRGANLDLGSIGQTRLNQLKEILFEEHARRILELGQTTSPTERSGD
jgi:hypothetical protein